MKRFAALSGFVALAFVGALPAFWIKAGWYGQLAQPTWAPPAWLFGPVWTLLYVLMGVSTWGVWLRRGWSAPLGLWLLQLALNTAWTPVFFGARQIGWALVEIVALWVAIVATVVAFARVAAWPAWLLAPYLAWVSFATALNFALWRLNP